MPTGPPEQIFERLCNSGHDFEFATLWDGTTTMRIDGQEVLKQESSDIEALERELVLFLEA